MHGVLGRRGAAVWLSLIAIVTSTATVASAATLRGTVNSKVPGGGDIVVWVDGPPAPTAVPPDAVLEQREMQFVPTLLVVIAGQSVQMPNEDAVAHNVFSVSPTRPFNLGIYEKGEVKKVTFPEPGIVNVRCSLHRRMKGQILVVPTSLFARADASGAYEIADVPPGKCTVKAWQVALPEPQAQPASVPRVGAATLNFVLQPPPEK
jgi:plastocyanin